MKISKILNRKPILHTIFKPIETQLKPVRVGFLFKKKNPPWIFPTLIRTLFSQQFLDKQYDLQVNTF